MSIFTRLSNLATFLDDALHQIEASFYALSTSSRNYHGAAAEISRDLQDEIQEMSEKLDQLISLGQGHADQFDQFINSMIEAITEFDEKIDKMEDYAANFGYSKPNKTKQDLKSLIFAQVNNS